MQHYIEITQDGIGRIARANRPNDVIGLYTCKIETCTVILIASVKGISLIHNTGKIRASDIAAEFRWHEKVIFWTVVYNPEYYPKATRNHGLGEMIAYYMDELIAVIGLEAFKKIKPQYDFILPKAKNEFVAFTIKGAIQLEERPLHIKEFKDKKLRHDINTTNNLFLNTDEFLPADIQYDGTDFTPLPSLFKEPAEVEAMAASARFQAYPLTELALQFYREYTALSNLPNINIDAILKEINTEAQEVEENDQGQPCTEQDNVANHHEVMRSHYK